MTDPRPEEFMEFHDLLVEQAPDGYDPWLFRCEAGSKAPDLSLGSWKDEEARLSKVEAVRWMEEGGNVGIAARGGCPGCDGRASPYCPKCEGEGCDDALVNVDIDDEDETTPDDLKDTLLARSRSRTGIHAWYFERAEVNIPNITTDDKGEVRANWQYVVAPGSYVETDPEDVPEDERDLAGYYTIYDPEPVSRIGFDELPAVFQKGQQDTDPNPELTDYPAAGEGKDTGTKAPLAGDQDSQGNEAGATDRDSDSALFNVTARDVAQREGGRTGTGDRWSAIFHDSDTGKNMMLSDRGLLQCWRHEVAHNGFQALCVLSDFRGDCADVGSGHQQSAAGHSCLRTDEGEAVWYAWKYAKQNGYIPDDDPVPYSALLYLCRARNLCAVTELPDGPDESIPGHAYDAALTSIREHDGVTPGRDKVEDIPDDGRVTTATPDTDQAQADGGTQTQAAGSSEPDQTTTDGDDEAGGFEVTLAPEHVVATAGEDPEETSVGDLDDRQKAACVWALCKQKDDIYVRVKRDTDELWSYHDGVWKTQGERVLREAARQAVGPMNYGENVLQELMSQVRADATVSVPADQFGVAEGTLAVENGLLDLRAAAEAGGQEAIRDLDPEDLALTRLPVQYDPDAEADRWRDLVEEWAEDGRADMLQEYAGYCLHAGGLPIHRALLLVGSGRNGKGTFLHVVRALLGEDNTTSIELQTLANEKDALAQFHGALANIDDDLSSRSLGKGLGMFKKLVGGDPVRARRLYQNGFEFKPTGKHLYAANKVPQVEADDEDEAFWSRWIMVEFPNFYPKSERDPDLRGELTEPEPMSGVLNWAIEGWRRLREQQEFTGELSEAYRKRQRWQQWGDTLDKFISECVQVVDDADNVSTAEVHDRYVTWCDQEGEQAENQRALTQQLKNQGAGYSRNLRVDGAKTRGFQNIKFTDDCPDPEVETDGDQERLG